MEIFVGCSVEAFGVLLIGGVSDSRLLSSAYMGKSVDDSGPATDELHCTRPDSSFTTIMANVAQRYVLEFRYCWGSLPSHSVDEFRGYVTKT